MIYKDLISKPSEYEHLSIKELIKDSREAK
jgi:hypothetical protein